MSKEEFVKQFLQDKAIKKEKQRKADSDYYGLYSENYFRIKKAQNRMKNI